MLQMGRAADCRSAHEMGLTGTSCWPVVGGKPVPGGPSVRMSPRSQNRFNQREVARALRAARLAGERPERVEIDPATGRITVIIAKTSDYNAKTGNEVEEWITKHADKR